jgi:hypothetical protein
VTAGDSHGPVKGYDRIVAKLDGVTRTLSGGVTGTGLHGVTGVALLCAGPEIPQ